MKYNKLVRDKIPEYIRAKGGNPVFHAADEREYWEKLKAKLLEESGEFYRDENKEEFADLLEVIDAIAEYRNFDRNDIEFIRKKKCDERGAFKKTYHSRRIVTIMRQTTLCFLRKEDSVLLGMKKRGFGTGRWNGIGGKTLPGESIVAAAVRELQEEIGVVVREEDLVPHGALKFEFKDREDWNQESHVFIIRAWQGEPKESEEMNPCWYNVRELPFDKMWMDDPCWLPSVLLGKTIRGWFLFDADAKEMLDFKVEEAI